MKRREFIGAACAAGVAAATMQGSAFGEEAVKSPMFLDLRMITVPDKEKMKKLVEFNSETTAAFAEGLGASPTGIFLPDPKLNAGNREYNAKYDDVFFGIVPHPDMNSIVEHQHRVLANKEYISAYREFSKGATSEDPLFTAHERMLLRCFDEFPEVKVPTLAEDRVLQLRFYRSHSFERNRAKMDMFTTGGELALFQECGLNPVFFTRMMYGPLLPCMVYMLSFEDEQHMKDAWAKFVNHPEWKKLSVDPKYADTATEITNIYLRPVEGSQI